MANISDTRVVEPLIDYCEKVFEDGVASVQFNNYKGLLSFMKEIDCNPDTFDSSDYSQLISQSPKLAEMVSILMNDEGLLSSITDDFFNSLVMVYLEGRLNDQSDEESYDSDRDEKNVDEFDTIPRECCDEALFFSKRDQLDSEKLFFQSLPKKVLTKEEEIELFKQYQAGDVSAKEKLIVFNLRLVAKVARRRINEHADFFDLVQAGYKGLVRAIDKFDLSKDCKFSTYAWNWIDQSIKRYRHNTNNTIRIPIHIQELLEKADRISRDYYKENGKEISNEQLAEELGITVQFLEEIILISETDSLNEPIYMDDGGSDMELGDLIANEADNPENIVLENSDPEDILARVEKFCRNDREKEMIRYNFGFVDGHAYNTEEIGKIYGISRQATHQIIQRIIKMARLDAVYSGIYTVYKDEVLRDPSTIRRYNRVLHENQIR